MPGCAKRCVASRATRRGDLLHRDSDAGCRARVQLKVFVRDVSFMITPCSFFTNPAAHPRACVEYRVGARKVGHVRQVVDLACGTHRRHADVYSCGEATNLEVMDFALVGQRATTDDDGLPAGEASVLASGKYSPAGMP